MSDQTVESIEDKYEIIRIVGEGSFGRVYKAIHRQTLQVVALKQIKHSQSSDVIEEIQALDRLRHPNIVCLHGIEIDSMTAYLVLEFMNATLDDHIRFRVSQGCPFPEDAIRSMSFQILKGLDWMHRQCGFMHRDLKPANILVGNGAVKISDLGSAIEINSVGMFNDFASTRYYRAPELLVQSLRGCNLENRNVFAYDEKLDMWSAGVIIAEMFLLSPIFMGENSADQLHKLWEAIGAPYLISSEDQLHKLRQEVGCYFRSRIPNASDLALHFISWLCSWDPEMRPSAEVALQHPFFTQHSSSVNAASSAGRAVRKEKRMTYAQALQKGMMN